MPVPILECVPNFSEGQDQRVIGAISAAIRATRGVQLLHVDANKDVNRTVMTFVGEQRSLGEAAYASISKAIELIDMRKHKGLHPRIGAADVCPFVPLNNTDMAIATELARRVGERVGSSLDVPVYMYGESTIVPGRYQLARIRSGGYEGLSGKIVDNIWKPDFGPAEFRPKSGACCIGSRKILIAFNVCLDTTDLQIAREIAHVIREGGLTEKSSVGDLHRKGGSLRSCRAIGWYLPDYNCTQVSLNLEDYMTTPPHVALESVRDQAKSYGTEVIGSEIVGMAPLGALLMAGQYYSRHESQLEAEQVEIAIQAMGLNIIKPFNPQERIIEYRLAADGRFSAGVAGDAVGEAVSIDKSN